MQRPKLTVKNPNSTWSYKIGFQNKKLNWSNVFPSEGIWYYLLLHYENTSQFDRIEIIIIN